MKCQYERDYLQVSHSDLPSDAPFRSNGRPIFRSGPRVNNTAGECGALWGERERVVWSISVVQAAKCSFQIKLFSRSGECLHR